MDYWLNEPTPSVRWIRWIFLRVLAVVNLAAFVSLAVQVRGLYGPDGVLPLADFLDRVHQVQPEGAFWLLPSLAWFVQPQHFLVIGSWGGAVLSGLLLLDLAPPLTLALLWVLYLSFVNVGQDFLGFQWDSLLVETDFLAIWLAPWQWLPKHPARQVGPPRAAWWMLRLLTARLMLHSGWVKLASGDPTWRNLTALRYHYWTQPLPNPLAWYADHLPVSFGSASVVAMLVIELVVPLLLFTPWARFAFPPLALLQILIGLTGNYGFFNLLTLGLCLSALDDRRLSNIEPPLRPRGAIASGLGVGLILVCTLVDPLPNWRLVNSYGLFAVMTTDRLEIQIEGSADGQHWEPYVFRYKPGPLDRRCPVAGLHMPRLDWQMWFASLGTLEQNPWFGRLCECLAHDSPAVLELMESGPRHPAYLRARLLRYRFGQSQWWTSSPAGDYLPPTRVPPPV